MNSQVHIIEGPLAPSPAPWEVEGAGAVICFEGVVRPTEAGCRILALDYEVYEPMASEMLRALADELAGRFALLGVCVEHSRGRVAVGQRSFRLRVGSRHRLEGLSALAEFIDRMKQDVPIWKSAVLADQTTGADERG